MDSVKVSVSYSEKASRLELFIRFVWGFIAMMVLGIIGMFAGLAIFVQWFHILLLGKRNASLAKFVNSWFYAMVGMYFYMYLSTDERCDIVPKF